MKVIIAEVWEYCDKNKSALHQMNKLLTVKPSNINAPHSDSK